MTDSVESATLRTFGQLRLDLPDGQETAPEFRSAKALVLLAYLIVEGRRPIDRAFLADLLWGDVQPQTARASLRQALHTIRRALGADAIISTGGTVRLGSAVIATDLDRLEHAFSAGDLRELLRWYGGPFCASVDFDGNESITRWIGVMRRRWQDRLIALATPQLQQGIVRGELAASSELARTLARVEPDLEGVAALAADVLVVAGEWSEARALLERARDRSVLSELPVPPDIVSRLGRLDRELVSRSRARSQSIGESHFDARFVGRALPLSRLFNLAERARAGLSARAVVVGPPGIGKSRLLDEIEARIGSRGLRVARVRYLQPMQATAWSALSEFARVLSALPGSIGVGERTASVLLGLLPELSARFSVARPHDVPAAGLVVARAEALGDLLGAVTDDRALALMQDDVQWIDAESRATIDQVLADHSIRLLDVRATRNDHAPLPSGTERIELAALSVEAVSELLGASGPSESLGTADPIVDALMSSTAGVPHLLMLELHRLAQEDVLRLQDGRWVLRSDADTSRLSSGSAALAIRLETLAETEQLVLRVVSMWRRAIEDDVLIVVLTALDPRPVLTEWRRALMSLEQAGFVLLRRNAWIVAHELIAESALRVATRSELVAVLQALIEASGPAGAMSAPILEHLALLCGQHHAHEAAELLVRRASRNRALRALRVRGPALARRVAAAAGRPEWERRLVRSLGLLERGTPRQQLILGAFGAAGAAFGVWLVLMLQPRIIVEVTPISGAIFLGVPPVPSMGFHVQPRVGVYDGFGNRVESFDGFVRATASSGRVFSDSVRAFVDGRAQFQSLAVHDPFTHRAQGRVWELTFSSKWWVRGVKVMPLGQLDASPDRFKLMSAVVNGDTVGTDGVARVPTGTDSLTVVLTYEFTAQTPTANYVVGAAPTWGDPRTATVRLAGLPRPVSDVWQTVSFRISAPTDASRQAIVIAMDQEGSVEHLFSQTNWAAGEPQWGDGNDLVRLPLERLARLRSEGVVTSAGMLAKAYGTRLGTLSADQVEVDRPDFPKMLLPREILGALIWVELVPPP